MTTAPRTTYSETAGTTPRSRRPCPRPSRRPPAGLARTERLQSVPCNATARITAAPIVLRADDVASAGTSAACCTTQVQRRADRRDELATTGINTKCDKHLALASGSGPVFGHGGPRAPVTREASRHATRYNKRLTLPSAPAPCHNSRVMGRPPAPQRILSSDRPEESTGPFRHRPTRRAQARSRPGPAPIGVGGRRRVGRPPSDRLGRRRRCPCRGRSSTVLWLDSGPSQ